MDIIWAFIAEYQAYIIIALGTVLTFLAGRNGSIVSALDQVWSCVVAVVMFFARALSEADGNGGKPSFTKVLGTIVVFKILAMTSGIPEEWMTLFWVLIGYSIISKLLIENPALLELIKMRANITAPPAKPTTPEA